MNFLKFLKIHFITPLVTCKVFEFAQHKKLQQIQWHNYRPRRLYNAGGEGSRGPFAAGKKKLSLGSNTSPGRGTYMVFSAGGPVGSWGFRFWHWRRQWSCRRFVYFVKTKRLLMIMLNCCRVNESWIVDITEFVIKKLSAVFAMKILLEFGGGVCNNLNFMNFKICCFKIRKNSWILGNF